MVDALDLIVLLILTIIWILNRD